jgi:hypothetical protein
MLYSFTFLQTASFAGSSKRPIVSAHIHEAECLDSPLLVYWRMKNYFNNGGTLQNTLIRALFGWPPRFVFGLSISKGGFVRESGQIRGRHEGTTMRLVPFHHKKGLSERLDQVLF